MASEEVREFLRQQGAKGGKIGGKRALDTMTPEERSARAKKAVAAREAKRKQKVISHPAPPSR